MLKKLQYIICKLWKAYHFYPISKSPSWNSGWHYLSKGLFGFCLFAFCLFDFQDRVSLCSAGYPFTVYVDQVGLELTEILLSLPPEYWDERHTPALSSSKGLIPQRDLHFKERPVVHRFTLNDAGMMFTPAKFWSTPNVQPPGHWVDKRW